MITQSVIIHSNNKNLKIDKVKFVLKLKFIIYILEKRILSLIFGKIYLRGVYMV